MNSETMNEISICSITSVFAKETTGELSVLPVSVRESKLELFACLNVVVESEFESVGPDLVIESVVKLSIYSVSGTEYELSVCPISVTELSTSPASVNSSNFELSVYPISGHESVCELPASPVSLNEPDYELPICPVSASKPVFELFVCPVPVNESDFELSVRPISVNESDFELSTCPISISELAYDLSACSVVTRGKLMDFLCSLPRSLKPYMLSLSLVFLFFLDSNLCCGFLISLFRCGALLIRRGVLLIRRGALLFRPGGLLLCLLRRGGLLLCLLRTGGLLLCLLRTGGLLLCLLHRGGLLPRLVPRGGLLSCSGGLLLRRGGLFFLLWWSSAPPWGSSGPSALLWWSSTPPVLPAPSWSPVLPVLPQSQGLTPLHGPGPPSLTLFRLRSTALLDCVMFGASGSRSLGGGGGSVMNPVHGLPFARHQRSLLHHIDTHMDPHVSRLVRPVTISLSLFNSMH